MTKRRFLRVLLASGLAALVCALQAATPSLAAAAPALKIRPQTPDYVTPGLAVGIEMSVENVGDEPFTGPVTIRTKLPTGIVPQEWSDEGVFQSLFPFECPVVGQEVECTAELSGFPTGMERLYRIGTTVEPSASGVLSGGLIEVSGSGLPTPFSRSFSLTVGTAGPLALKAFGVEMSPTPDGQPPTVAGSDPKVVSTRFEFVSEAATPFAEPAKGAIIAPPEHFRDIVAHVPPGFLGDPSATPTRCPIALLSTGVKPPGESAFGIPQCPAQSQVGVIQLNRSELQPLFNLVPPPGYPAAFGFYYAGAVATLLAKVRPTDYGVDLVSYQVNDAIPLPAIEVTLWGVPSDSSHDHQRTVCLLASSGYNPQAEAEYGCALPDRERNHAPFFRTPTSCPGTKLKWGIEMDTYENVGKWVGKETETGATEGCEKLPFDPSISVAPSTRSANSPSGLDVGVTMPQDRTATGLAEADVRSVRLELPEGVAINSASAGGLAACSDAQLRLGLEGPSDCPDAAKIGSLELKSPLLEDAIGGSVYLRTQASSDPESGELFRLALEIRSDERGVDIKLPGSLVVNRQTGQLTTTFENLPQLPFESMQLHLKTGPRAPLTTPSTCGTYAAHAEFEGWNGKTASFDPTLTVDQGCTAAPFAPGFEAGVANATAGEFAPFSLRVTRGSGQPNVSRIDATLPEGEVAKLAGVPVCGEAQAQSGDCPAASRVGSVVAGIGEGDSPLFLPEAGKAPTAVYFAGPYKGAPYSIVAKVPAQAGPFDLGQVLVRSAVRIDPESVQVTVASDPLPQIFQGVPVSYRDVRVQVDRPNYTLNPTDCEPMAVTGAIASVTGLTANVSDRFQVADCAALGFKPRLAISLRGKARRSGHPALTAVLRMPKGGANIARTSVSLPHSEFLAQSHIVTSCTRVQYNAGAGGGAGCPKGSVYGRARAFSPLLDRPLEGPVYLRSNGGDRPLPDLVASLGGQIHVDLVGYIDTDRKTGGLRTTFAKVPDAPVSKFVLKMPGGKKSLLENSTDICRGQHRAVVKMDGQNGRVHDFMPLVRARCGKGARAR